MTEIPTSPAGAAIEPDAGLARIRDQVAAAIAARRPLQLLGAGTKRFLQAGPVTDGGAAAAGAAETIDCTQTRGIVSYEPSELFITVRAGTPLTEVEAALAEHRQCLPFEPPTFDGRATVGGMVATGLSGPRRATAGALRDYVLGTVLLDGRNRLLRFGGEVMKNVAGYDVSRLLAGSHGWLGVIAEVSLKVLPRPEVEVTLAQSLEAGQAVRRFNQWGGQPLPITATSWFAGRAHIRLSGSEASVHDAVGRIGGDRIGEEQAARWWAELREQRHAFFDPAQPLWRLSLPAVTAPVELGAPQLIEWGGALRWCSMPASGPSPEMIRAAATDVGGTAAIHRMPTPVPQAYVDFPRAHPLPPVAALIHQRLKEGFDPERIFNPAAEAVLGC